MRVLQLALVAGLLTLLALPAPARSDLLWGVNGHPFTAYPGISHQQQLELVKDLGLRSYRVNISVPSQAPMLAKLVAAAKPLGIDILPVFTPALSLKAESAEQLYARAYKMAVALVSQFKNDIRVWELGNELENYAIIKACEMRDNGEQYNCNWGPAGGVSPLDYYGPRWAKVSAVLKGLSEGTMSVDPSIRKAIGTAGWGHLGAFERMQQDGIKWDISVWHSYGQDFEWAFKTLVKYNRPIWVTEFNNPEGSKSSEDEQARGLEKQIKRLRFLQNTYNVEAAHIYELLDEPYWAPDYEAYMGLVHLKRNDQGRWSVSGRKPAYNAVKTLIANVPGEQTAQTASISAFHRQGCDLDQIANTKQASTAEAQVDYAYCLILDRPVDGGGLSSWKASIESGKPATDIVLAILNSDEFAHKHTLAKLSNPAFVSLMYSLLLDREPDGGSLASYANQLERGNAQRTDVAESIVASGEFRSKHPILFASAARSDQMQRLTGSTRNCDPGSGNPTAEMQAAYIHCLVLGRTADASMLAKMTEALSRGTPPLKLVTALLESNEFSEQYRSSSLNDSEFVELVYRLLLDREPDVAGLSSYRELIDRGALSRIGIAKALIESSEFRAKRPLLFSAAQPAH